MQEKIEENHASDFPTLSSTPNAQHTWFFEPYWIVLQKFLSLPKKMMNDARLHWPTNITTTTAFAQVNAWMNKLYQYWWSAHDPTFTSTNNAFVQSSGKAMKWGNPFLWEAIVTPLTNYCTIDQYNNLGWMPVLYWLSGTSMSTTRKQVLKY
jgi:hypothetical protein